MPKLGRSKVRSKIGLLGLFSIICVSVYLIYLSATAGYDIIINKLDPWDFVFNLVLFLFGVGALIGGLKMARNIILLDEVFDTTFEEEIYPRLEPALREVAKMQVKLDAVEERVAQVNMNVNRMKENPPEYKQPIGALNSKLKIYALYLFMLNFTVGYLYYVFSYAILYLPFNHMSIGSQYLLTILFPVWWFVITIDFKLLKKDVVWFWAFFPIMITPVGILLLQASRVNYGSIIGFVSLFLLIYILAYHSWAKYYVEGVTPMDRLKRLRSGADDIEEEAVEEVERKRQKKKKVRAAEEEDEEEDIFTEEDDDEESVPTGKPVDDGEEEAGSLLDDEDLSSKELLETIGKKKKKKKSK